MGMTTKLTVARHGQDDVMSTLEGRMHGVRAMNMMSARMFVMMFSEQEGAYRVRDHF